MGYAARPALSDIVCTAARGLDAWPREPCKVGQGVQIA